MKLYISQSILNVSLIRHELNQIKLKVTITFVAVKLLKICPPNQGNSISGDQQYKNFPWEHAPGAPLGGAPCVLAEVFSRVLFLLVIPDHYGCTG